MAASQPVSVFQDEARSMQLRFELKQWERDFAASHNGKKAGREDIKQHPEIASKYKTYDRIRRGLSKSSKSNQNADPITTTKKRSSSIYEASQTTTVQTPSKRAKHAHPLKSQPVNAFASHPLHPALLDPYDPPPSTFLSPSRARISLGPTPQKDGKVLGLFDILSSASPSSADRTPSKRKILNPIAGNSRNAADALQATPSKDRSGTTTHQKLPGSASKDEGLSTVFTPSKHRVAKPTTTTTTNNTPVRTGSSAQKLRFDDTPAFLRRDNQRGAALTASLAGSLEGGLIDEGDEDTMPWSPVMPRRTSRLHRPLAGRGLSALVQGLREMEEARHDEDLDILREMEGGGGGGGTSSFASKMLLHNQQTATAHILPKIQIGDSQSVEMPLGPDRAVESEEDDDDEEAKRRGMRRDGKPVKAWKKKGQKRTTRAVKMRPSAARWKPEPAWKGGVDIDADNGDSDAEGEGKGEGEDALVGETQITSQSDLNKVPDVDDEQTQTQKMEKAEGGGGGGQGIIQKLKKTVRKTTATAHANFRALKIRGKGGGKGKGSGGRWGGRGRR